MIKAIVIEDEINSQELLVNLLTNYCTGVKVLGTADDVQSGIALIRKCQPELVFLDIEMPDGNGFDVLDICQEENFQVVFVTGYDQYAIKAIKYAALDYLVKPISFTELSQVIQRYSYQKFDSSQQIELLQQSLQQTEEPFSRLVLRDKNERVVLNLDEIIYLRAQDRQVSFFLEDQKPRIVSNTLSHYVTLLPTDQFVRIHKSFLVNLAKVNRIEEGRTGQVYLKDGTELSIAARRKTELIKRWQQFKNREA